MSALFMETLKKMTSLAQIDLEPFLQIFRPGSLAKGQDFIREGEIGQSLAFVTEGLLRSYYISPKGEEVNKHFFVAGSFFAPLTSLVLKVPSPVYIGALEPSRFLQADYNDILHLYEEFPILNKIGRVAMEYAWVGKERRETQLVMQNATERYSEFQVEYPDLEQRIPLYHIASYLGITPVQFSRIRAKLSS